MSFDGVALAQTSLSPNIADHKLSGISVYLSRLSVDV